MNTRTVAAALLALLAACAGRRPAVTLVPAAPAERVEVSLFLIGDAGAPAPGGEPVLAALARDLAAAPGAGVVVFLGDNIYPSGMPDSARRSRPEAERRLDAQLAVLATAPSARAIFVAGNHDWGGDDGWEAVRRQGRHIGRHGAGRAELLPGEGCPGPVARDIGRGVRIVALDTQWWLHGGPKPRDPTSACPADSEGEVIDSLREALTRAGDRHVVVVAHHPLAAAGPHGGNFPWTDHIFPLRAWKSWLWVPLPIIGSAYPLARQLGITSQDLSGSANRRMRDAFTRAFAGRQPLVYAAGHEHSLEVLAGPSAKYVLVSGTGIWGHNNRVGYTDSTFFALKGSGYMRLDVLTDRRVRLAVLVVDEAGRAAERYSMWLE